MSASRPAGSTRRLTTPTARDASATCTVAPEKAGAIFTAVWVGEVVAPPMRRGRSRPVRSISFATWTIWSREGVISPERPSTSTFRARASSRMRSAGTMTPRSSTS